MRPIKFRFWLGDINKMTYSHTIAEIAEVLPKFHDGVIPLQYTGLTDKNGVEIYENDIDKKHGVVRWVQDYCEYVFENEEGFTSLTKNLCELESEIIGNTYEHPHLIK